MLSSFRKYLSIYEGVLYLNIKYTASDRSQSASTKKEITFRGTVLFMKDIQTSTILRCTSGTTDDLVEACNSGIEVLIENKHDSSMSNTIVMSAVQFEGQHLTHFKPATRDEVRVVIMKSPSMSCESTHG